MAFRGEYLIVADDLTGASDTGVQLRRHGIPVRVAFKSGGESGSCVIDTESRALSPAAAAESVRLALSGLESDSFLNIFKKVDSTLRGAIAAEVAAMDSVFRPELLLFAPALPDMGRTTEGGIHHLKGERICETEMARDPRTPVLVDDLRLLMKESFDEDVRHISLDDLRSGPDFGGGRIFTADAITNDDLDSLVIAAKATGRRILWVGTAALADSLLRQERTAAPALAVVTSLNSVTKAQVKYAVSRGAKCVPVPVDLLLCGRTSSRQIREEASAHLAAGKDVLLVSSASWEAEGYERALASGADRGFSPAAVSSFLLKNISEIAKGVIGEQPVSGVFLSGGDAAVSFLLQMGASCLDIETEISFGIPLSRLRGGRFDSLRVVTKAGGFGAEDAIFYALRKLKEKDS